MIRDAVSRALAALRRAARRPAILVLVAEPESALLASAAALRRLGARLTRYDGDNGTIEARVAGGTVRLAIRAAGGNTARLEVTADAPGARALLRRFRSELARPTSGATG